MRAVEHAPVWEWRAWWWIPDERDVPQIPPETDERRTEHVCLDSDRVGAVGTLVLARICGGSGPLYHHGLGRDTAPVEGDTLLHLAYRLRAAEPVLDVLRAAGVMDVDTLDLSRKLGGDRPTVLRVVVALSAVLKPHAPVGEVGGGGGDCGGDDGKGTVSTHTSSSSIVQLS